MHYKDVSSLKSFSVRSKTPKSVAVEEDPRSVSPKSVSARSVPPPRSVSPNSVSP